MDITFEIYRYHMRIYAACFSPPAGQPSRLLHDSLTYRCVRLRPVLRVSPACSRARLACSLATISAISPNSPCSIIRRVRFKTSLWRTALDNLVQQSIYFHWDALD
eukprot:6179516-Pleurochrysis_carterae.AAC.2